MEAEYKYIGPRWNFHIGYTGVADSDVTFLDENLKGKLVHARKASIVVEYGQITQFEFEMLIVPSDNEFRISENRIEGCRRLEHCKANTEWELLDTIFVQSIEPYGVSGAFYALFRTEIDDVNVTLGNLTGPETSRQGFLENSLLDPLWFLKI